MSGTRPWIAYVGPVGFPEGGAAARRILGNAKAIVAAGWDVTIVSGQPPGAEGAQFDVAPGIDCVRLNERDAEHLPKALRYTRYLTMGARSRDWIGQHAVPPAAIILYSGYSPYLLQFTGWAQRRGIPVIFDAVEWYTAPSALGFVTSPYHWNVELAMRALIPRCNGVIAISRALETYFSGRGVPCCRIPPLIDTGETPVRGPVSRTGPLRLVYAGQPGRKDLIDAIVTAVVEADAGRKRLHLDIVGVSERELLARPGLAALSGTIPDCITAHGVVPHAKAVHFVAEADFTIFLREINRVSTNGFSTKFVESLGLGTPVITNLTGDLSLHLQDGKTGFVCETPTAAALADVLRKALDRPESDLNKMRGHAREEAERAFDFHSRVATLRCFLDMFN